jgi:hypothetical protein
LSACGKGMTDTGIVVTAGTWSYSLTDGIPTPGSSCKVTASGTATVAADGSYSVTFPALSCSGCTMNASASGTIVTASISGTVTASITGSGCSSQPPTPNPASASGSCNASSCQATTADGDSFAVTYTLTPPA